ncbi:MAG: hypothetical protein V3V99_02235 [candidate division Zixibacteria bacterium]
MKFNLYQRIIIGIGMVLILLTFLFPCWRSEPKRIHSGIILEYSFVFSAPDYHVIDYEPPIIDFRLMAFQFITIILLTTGGTLIAKSRNNKAAR